MKAAQRHCSSPDLLPMRGKQGGVVDALQELHRVVTESRHMEVNVFDAQ